MQVNITFRHLESTEALKAHAKEKVNHIQRFISRPSEGHVVLYVEGREHHADITVHAGPFFLRGRAKSDDMYASIDLAVDKIERQLKKHKEKLNNSVYRTHGPHGFEPADIRHDVFHTDDGPSNKVVKSSSFKARPMTLDEAVVQMDLANNQFLVFQNPKDRAINVLYRREDGKYGLIEARS